MQRALWLAALLVAGSWSRAAADVDWRSKGAVTPVKNEGTMGCSLSWSFATTGVIEGATALRGGALRSLAEQELIDCAGNCGGSSAPQCPLGGCPDLGCVFTFAGVHGLCSEADYPFTARIGNCKSTCSPVVAPGFAANWVRVTPGDETALISALNQAPVLARLEIGSAGSPLPAYLTYSGGVLSPPPTDATIVQWVLIVGYRGTPPPPNYIVKNSLGTGWGASGYLFLKRGVNALGIANFAYSLEPGPATTGACFTANQACVEVDKTTCLEANGTFTSVGTFCTTPCPEAVSIARVPALSHRAFGAFALLLAAAGVALLLRHR